MQTQQQHFTQCPCLFVLPLLLPLLLVYHAKKSCQQSSKACLFHRSGFAENSQMLLSKLYCDFCKNNCCCSFVGQFYNYTHQRLDVFMQNCKNIHKIFLFFDRLDLHQQYNSKELYKVGNSIFDFALGQNVKILV